MRSRNFCAFLRNVSIDLEEICFAAVVCWSVQTQTSCFSREYHPRDRTHVQLQRGCASDSVAFGLSS